MPAHVNPAMYFHLHKRSTVAMPIILFALVVALRLFTFSIDKDINNNSFSPQIARAIDLTSDSQTDIQFKSNKPRGASCAKRKQVLQRGHRRQNNGEHDQHHYSLPSFLVIGVHKGGTTSLYRYLTQHQHVRTAACKETHFLSSVVLNSDSSEKGAKETNSRPRVAGIRWMAEYASYFPDLHNFPHAITGEATPSYLRLPSMPQLVASRFPNMKLIVTLRDPVDRFVSHYVGFNQRGLTALSCDEFFSKNIESIDHCVKQRTADFITSQTDKEYIDHFPNSGIHTGNKNTSGNASKGLSSDHHAAAIQADKDPLDVMVNRSTSSSLKYQPTVKPNLNSRTTPTIPTPYHVVRCAWQQCSAELNNLALMRSMYAAQLSRWLKHFPPSQIYVLQAEDLFTNTPQVMQNVADFLGLRPFMEHEIKSFGRSKQGSHHSADQLSQTCDRTRIAEYLVATTNHELKEEVLVKYFPYVIERWQAWSTDSLG